MDVMKDARGKLRVLNGEAGEVVPTKLQAVLKISTGFSTFTGDDVNSREHILSEFLLQICSDILWHGKIIFIIQTHSIR
jgi:hypothetical protein